jgi:hypothetical protein
LDETETRLNSYKSRADEGETHKTTGENLSRKVAMLEEELERTEKELKETHEKWVNNAQGARFRDRFLIVSIPADSATPMSRPSTLSDKSPGFRRSETTSNASSMRPS